MSLYNFAFGNTALHLSASASQASTVTGSAVDITGYDAPLVVIQSHGTGTGTLDGKIQDSADGSTGWTDVSGAAFTQRTTTAAVDSLVIDPRAVKRYIRYVGTIGTGPQNVGVVAVGIKRNI